MSGSGWLPSGAGREQNPYSPYGHPQQTTHTDGYAGAQQLYPTREEMAATFRKMIDSTEGRETLQRHGLLRHSSQSSARGYSPQRGGYGVPPQYGSPNEKDSDELSVKDDLEGLDSSHERDVTLDGSHEQDVITERPLTPRTIAKNAYEKAKKDGSSNKAASDIASKARRKARYASIIGLGGDSKQAEKSRSNQPNYEEILSLLKK